MTKRNGRSSLALHTRRLVLRWTRFTQPVLGPFRARWQRSLKLRTMTITGLITGIMILISGTYILTSIGDDLYSSRRAQILQDSARATVAAQALLDATDASDRGTMSTLVGPLYSAVQGASSSQLILVRRQYGQGVMPDAPADFTTQGSLLEVVTPELTKALAEAKEPQYWQAVTLPDTFGTPGPGILVASTLTFPAGTGKYDLFIGYNLSDTAGTLQFIERTLMFTAFILMVLIGALVWSISRIVFRPIRAAADASRRLAGGETDARMPKQNDEHFDVLSENFNDMADTLQARISELDHLSEMQQRFVSDVSHELRTPLTTIRLASEVLQAGHDGFQPAQGRAVEVLGDQVRRFETLLTDLLEISRYDAGRVTIETESINLVRLTTEVVDGLQPLSQSRLEVRPLGGFSPIEVDPRRIRRIISNLVGNAIEHGEGKPIVVTIDSNASAISIGVRDWGVGMSETQLEQVFDRFWRADPSRKRTLGGTGLGLAIAREDAAVHGGLLDVWSKQGEGTHFRLTLPRGEHTHTFVAPIPLRPDGTGEDEAGVKSSSGWLRRPLKRGAKEKR